MKRIATEKFVNGQLNLQPSLKKIPQIPGWLNYKGWGWNIRRNEAFIGMKCESVVIEDMRRKERGETDWIRVNLMEFRMIVGGRRSEFGNSIRFCEVTKLWNDSKRFRVLKTINHWWKSEVEIVIVFLIIFLFSILLCKTSLEGLKLSSFRCE